MIVKSIHELNRAVPFRPYEIRMASGESFKVPHPDFVFVAPNGSFVIYVDADHRSYRLSTHLIEKVAVCDSRARKTGKG